MKFADIKPGMRARIIGNNDKRPGGSFGDARIGREIILGAFTRMKQPDPHFYDADFNGEQVWGYFRIVEVIGHPHEMRGYVIHPSQFVVIADEEGNPVVDGVIKKKPLRGADGRFLPKEVKEAPVKKKAEPVLDEEGLLEKALREELKNEGEAGLDVSTNGLRYTDGSYRLNAHDICAYRWYPVGHLHATHAIVIIDDYYKGYDGETQLAYQEFLLYMFNESPWKNCFVTKDVKHALDHCVSFNVNEKRSHVVNAQQVMRQFSEFEYFRKTYKAARLNGFAVKHAVFIACFFTREADGKYIARPDGGHSCVNKYSDVTQLKKTFSKGVLNDCGDEAYKKPTLYLGPICNAVANSLGTKDNYGFYNVAKRIADKTEEAGWGARVAKFSAIDLALVIGFVFG